MYGSGFHAQPSERVVFLGDRDYKVLVFGAYEGLNGVWGGLGGFRGLGLLRKGGLRGVIVSIVVPFFLV